MSKNSPSAPVILITQKFDIDIFKNLFNFSIKGTVTQ